MSAREKKSERELLAWWSGEAKVNRVFDDEKEDE
jgi:hypothetical protein